jgi:hypothetical protein
MSDLLDIQEKLQDTAAMLAQLERDLARHPDAFGVQLNIMSLEKRKRKLETELSAATAAMGLEVCSYRIMPEQARVKLAGVTGTLGDYQSLVSSFYNAIKNGAKHTAKLGAEVAAQTAFDFAYAFTGSVGFVFTVPNETTLFDNTVMDESIRLIFEVAKAQRPEDILAFARRLGPAPIRALYKWADDHVKASFSADIEWRRGEVVRQKVLIQWLEFERLRQAISETSDESSEEFTLGGLLVGTDVTKRTFHFQPDDGSDVRGKSGEVISPSHPVEVPKRYEAALRKTTKIHYSTEQEDVSYELLKLEAISISLGSP